MSNESYHQNPSVEIPWKIFRDIIPDNQMMETEAPPFTLARLNSLHTFAADLTQNNLVHYSLQDIIRIGDIGSDNMFPLLPLVKILEKSGYNTEISAIDLNQQKLEEGVERPELKSFVNGTNPVKIVTLNEDGAKLPLEDNYFDETRIIGVFDGSVQGDPQEIINEVDRVTRSTAMISFRSPYLDRLLPSIEQTANQILWNDDNNNRRSKSGLLQKGYPLSRRTVIDMLLETDFSSLTFYGQLPITYSYQTTKLHGQEVTQYIFHKLPQLRAVSVNGNSIVLPTNDYCQLHKINEIDLTNLRETQRKHGIQYLNNELIQMMTSSEESNEQERRFTQYMFWLAEIKK